MSQDDCVSFLESDLILACQLVRVCNNKQNFDRLCIQTRTQKHFTQIKFNLLREENEGFSKLIVELSQKNIDAASVQHVSENIQSLIGYFSLDPSRVLDILLTAFEYNLENLCYLTLL